MIIPRSVELRPEHAPLLLWLGIAEDDVRGALGLTPRELVEICRRRVKAHPRDLHARGCRTEARQMVRRIGVRATCRVCGISRQTLLQYLEL